MATLADTLRQFGTRYLAQHTLSTPQAKAWRAIVACRTRALGGTLLACDHCQHRRWQYHSCRNRHCPQCGSRAKDAWLQARLAEVLPVPYAHLVFTLPHSLNTLYGAHPRWVIDTLFAATAQTLTEFAANPKWISGTGGARGARPAFSLVLHTWTQDLRRHLHIHAVMACGALDDHGQWCRDPRASLTSCFRSGHCRTCFAASSWRRCRRHIGTGNSTVTRTERMRLGVRGRSHCIATTGSSMPRHRWVARLRHWNI